MAEHEFFTDPQRLSRLPKRPWHIHVHETGGTTAYQVQADDGGLVCSLVDADFDLPGAARAIAESLVKWANAEADAPPPSKSPPSVRPKLRLV
ncbi:MAG TPA: hypothetical protein VF765_06155 [Polyangiaceae bacterium]